MNTIQFADRAAWLAERKNGIGASEAAAVLGLSPYRSPLDVFLTKTGRKAEFEGNEATAWGSAKEPLLAKSYEDTHGCTLRQQVFVRSEEHPFMFATIDGMLPGGNLVEFKTAGWRQASQWGEEDSDDIPVAYLAQVQHQMAVTGAETCFVWAEIGGEPPRRFTVERSDKAIESIVEKEGAFWERVLADLAPTSLQMGDSRWMHLLFPEANGAFSFDRDEATIVDAWLDLKLQAKEIEEKTEAAKTVILGIFGPHEIGRLPDGRLMTRKVVAVKPSCCKACGAETREGYSRVDLRIKKGRES